MSVLLVLIIYKKKKVGGGVMVIDIIQTLIFELQYVVRSGHNVMFY